MVKDATKVALSRAKDEKRKNYDLAESFLKKLVEGNSKLVQGKNFGFSDKKKTKTPRIIRIHTIHTESVPRMETASIIKNIFSQKDIIIEDNSVPVLVSIKPENVHVSKSFIEYMDNKKNNANMPDQKTDTSPKDDVFKKTGHDLILELVKIYDVKAFEKKRDEKSITFSLPDSDEKDFATQVFDSFLFEKEICADFCLKVFVKEGFKESDLYKIEKFGPTDRSRFRADLAIAIMITRWELLRQKLNVIIPDDDLLNKDATKSKPFKATADNKGKSETSDFIAYMMNNYAIDIRSEVHDPHIFRVLSPKDPEHAGTKKEQEKRKVKDRENLNPLTILIKSWGYCVSEGLANGLPYVRIHYKGIIPENIEIIHGNEADKKALVNEIYQKLLETKDYAKHLVGKGRKGTRIYFEYKVRNLSKSLSSLTKFLVKKGLFETSRIDNKKNPGFRTQNKPDHIIVATQCSIESKRKDLLDKIEAFLVSEGFKNIEFDKRANFSMKVLNNDPGYENVKKFFNNTDSNLAGEVIIGKTDKGETKELVKQTTVEDSSKSFGNQMIGFLIKQLNEDPDLYEKIGMLYKQQNPAETKRLVSDILTSEFANAPVSFEGPMGKFYSAEEVQNFISRVIGKLPS